MSSQTAETKVERRIGWIPEQVAGDLEAGKSGRGAHPDGVGCSRGLGTGVCTPDFRLHASSAYFKSPYGYTASIHYPEPAVSLVHSLSLVSSFHPSPPS